MTYTINEFSKGRIVRTTQYDNFPEAYWAWEFKAIYGGSSCECVSLSDEDDVVISA